MYKADGITAFVDIRELECQLKDDFEFQLDEGQWTEKGYEVDDTVDVCPGLVLGAGSAVPVFDENCAKKEAKKQDMIDHEREKALKPQEFVLFLTNTTKPYLANTVNGEGTVT